MSDPTPLPLGKLPADLLAALLRRHAPRDPRVLLGPGVGEDAAVIDMGDRCLVAKTDPVTFATDEIGWYAVHVNANDIACCGAVPRWFLATVLLPEGATTPALVTGLFAQIDDACATLGVSVVGGHTEIAHGLDRPIVVGQMLGEAPRARIVTTAGARPGDVLLLSKAIALEGTAIAARERAADLGPVLGAEALARAAGLLHEPGISVVADAAAALAAGGVHALHDPTEGGLATGLHEVCEASGCGVLVEEDRVPLLPECRAVCDHLGLDPLGLIASGSLLVAAAPERADGIAAALRARGIACTAIGTLGDAGGGRRLRRRDGALVDLPAFARDEIARLFE